MAKTFVLVLALFTKKLKPVLGLNKGLTLRLVGGRLKQVLNKEHALTNAHFKVHLCTVCIDFLKKVAHVRSNQWPLLLLINQPIKCKNNKKIYLLQQCKQNKYYSEHHKFDL